MGELPITDEQFKAQYTAAVDAKDNDAVRRLVTLAGTSVARWMHMVGKAKDDTTLGWVERQIATRGIRDQGIADAIYLRREELAS